MRPSLTHQSVWLGLLLGCTTAFANEKAAKSLPDPDRVLQLAPYRVLAPNFTIKAQVDDRRVIVRIGITEIAPHSAADHGGLRVGDELLAVDGKSIPGMKYDDLVAAITADFSDGHSLTYSFAGRRGLFRSQTVRIDAVYSLNLKGPPDAPSSARLAIHPIPSDGGAHSRPLAR